MAVATICAVVCYLKVPETHNVDIESDASVANLGVKAKTVEATGDD
jgi:hypothetical protein